MNNAVNFETLQSLSGYTKPYDVAKWAREHGIKVFTCKKGISTTQDALNQALGVSSNSDQYAVDIL